VCTAKSLIIKGVAALQRFIFLDVEAASLVGTNCFIGSVSIARGVIIIILPVLNFKKISAEITPKFDLRMLIFKISWEHMPPRLP